MLRISAISRSFDLSSGSDATNGLLSRTMLGLGAALAISSSAFAHTTYTNTVLNGCYSYRVHTTATSTIIAGKGQELLGTMCFSGNGGVKDGHMWTTNGLVGMTSTSFANTEPGSYAFGANLPYFGMGTIKLGAPFPIVFADAVNDVSSGVAGGFQLMRILADSNADILGGAARYQAPAGYSYTAAVLNGCYSYLSETTLTAPVLLGPGKDLLGVICFTPGSGQTGTVTFGYDRNTNGIPAQFNGPIGGTYTVDNYPGWGMGSINFPGGLSYEFDVHDVDPNSGIAAGFQFSLETPGVGGQTRMEGGNAVFQQP